MVLQIFLSNRNDADLVALTKKAGSRGMARLFRHALNSLVFPVIDEAAVNKILSAEEPLGHYSDKIYVSLSQPGVVEMLSHIKPGKKSVFAKLALRRMLDYDGLYLAFFEDGYVPQVHYFDKRYLTFLKMPGISIMVSDRPAVKRRVKKKTTPNKVMPVKTMEAIASREKAPGFLEAPLEEPVAKASKAKLLPIPEIPEYEAGEVEEQTEDDIDVLSMLENILK